MKFSDTDGAFGDDGYIEIWNRSLSWYYIKFVESDTTATIPTGVTVKRNYDPVGKGDYTDTYYAGDTLPNFRWFNDDMDRSFRRDIGPLRCR